MKVMVCGGAGYVGAHVCLALAGAGHDVVVLDNLSTGHAKAVDAWRLHRVDLCDGAAVREALADDTPDAVVHLAAVSIVLDSMRDPAGYQRINVGGTRELVAAMTAANVHRLVFSSSAAVYGTPSQHVIDETHACRPINPYGETKLAVERMLQTQVIHGLRSVSLRYFNAAGADLHRRAGESHDPETHLIPNTVRSALGITPAIRIFGTDYPTADGTCVRDYVHVADLARAHVQALEWLAVNDGAHAINLGSGQGYSVRQILDALGGLIGASMPHILCMRREGDPARLVASNQSARRLLGWQPQISDLHTILRSALAWHRDPRYGDKQF